MKSLFLLLSMLMLVASSCAIYKVEGNTTVATLNGKKLYIKVADDDGLIDLDSCEIVHGNFKMDGDVDSVMLGTLFIEDEGLMPIVIEAGKINISIKNTGLKVSGTPLNNKLYDFIEQKTAIEQKIIDLSHNEIQLIINGTSANEAETKTRLEIDKATDELNRLVADFVTGNFDNLLGIQIFATYCGSLPYPTITPTIQEIMEEAPETFKNDPFVIDFIRLTTKDLE